MQLPDRRLGVAVALLLAAPLAYAGSSPTIHSASDENRPVLEQDLLGGVITSRTITVLGWDFFQYFTAKWEAIHGK